MRKAKQGRMVGFYAVGARYDQFRDSLPPGRASAHIDALIRFFLENREKFELKYGGPEVGEYLEYKP